jgi:hypothetical protein
VANLILLFQKIGENGTCPSWAVAFIAATSDDLRSA